MTIDDIDLFDLAVWVAWKKHMTAVPFDDRRIRNRKALYTSMLLAAATFLGFRWAGPYGALLLATAAAMYSCEVIFNAPDDEALSVAEFLLYSEDCPESHKRYLVNQVRNAVTSYESAEFAVLSDMVGAHPLLQQKIEHAIQDYLKLFACYQTMSLPEGRYGDPMENL